MTPKEKAIELVLKFEDYTDCADERGFAIKCALIAVDEIINGYEFDLLDIEHKRIMDNINFWDKVKQEIEKL
jgi:hypothetical protein